MREIKIRNYTCGLIVTIVGLGLYSYYVRELLAALTIFSMAFFFLALLGLGALLIWSAGVQIAITQPIRLEDAVIVEGEWGWVEEITSIPAKKIQNEVSTIIGYAFGPNATVQLDVDGTQYTTGSSKPGADGGKR